MHSEFSTNKLFAKSLQSCPTLCDPIYGSPPGSPVPGILQARTLEWVAISFSSDASVPAKLPQSCPTLCEPMDHSPPGSSVHGFSREEYQSGLPYTSPGNLPNPGIEPMSLLHQQVSLLPLVPPGKPKCTHCLSVLIFCYYDYFQSVYFCTITCKICIILYLINVP